MPIRGKNYWLETVDPQPTQPPRDLPDKVDVAIVGGGLCGLSAAPAPLQRAS